jgi:hypothetical protein
VCAELGRRYVLVDSSPDAVAVSARRLSGNIAGDGRFSSGARSTDAEPRTRRA